MPEQTNGNSNSLNYLTAPARNHYFYGKLLDVMHFEMEQRYFNQKRWGLNRLSLGKGVMCGLEVELAEDNTQVIIRPGVAIDGYGREIVVPAAYCLENPRQPTNERGEPTGEPISGAGSVSLCLAYHECKTEPVPVLVGDCDTEQGCAPSTIRERYRLLVREGLPEQEPGQVSDEQCQAIFPAAEQEETFSHRLAACQNLQPTCDPVAEACVVLATITFPAEDADGSPEIDVCTYRTTIYSNATLLDLIFCLAARVDECCRVRMLRYVSGDAQQAGPGNFLAEPLVVEVVNGEGDPVPDEPVTFRVRGGDGRIDTPAGPEPEHRLTTAADGQAQVRWQIGPNPGLNTLEARLDSGSHVLFQALGVVADGEVTLPPVILTIWPPNASQLPENSEWFEIWREQPRLELTFDREMNPDQISDPAPWLRVWQLLDVGEIIVRPVALGRPDETTEPILGQDGFTVGYPLRVEEPGAPTRYLVQIRARGGNITDTGSPPRLLDPDFAGANLNGGQLNLIWDIDDETVFGERDLWEALEDTGATLPRSGDGAEAGRFHSWFEVSEQ